jgi:type IV secretory pathway VirB6-like protein
MSDSLFFRDFNIEISRKFNKKLLVNLVYYNQAFNASANIVAQTLGYIYTNIAVVDVTYKLNKKHSLRGELQGLWTKQDKGDWATVVLEYTISPHWTFGIIDQWNYGNDVSAQRVHYLLGSVSYITGSTRFMLNVGKQRAGIFCVGGICRQVPASNGFTFSFTHSF